MRWKLEPPKEGRGSATTHQVFCDENQTFSDTFFKEGKKSGMFRKIYFVLNIVSQFNGIIGISSSRIYDIYR